MSMATAGSFKEYVPLKQKLNSMITQFYQSVEVLENTGVVVKSIDEGLLDFPSKRFNEEVWLCWKYGETEIKFWHEKDSGFMARKPIRRSVTNHWSEYPCKRLNHLFLSLFLSLQIPHR